MTTTTLTTANGHQIDVTCWTSNTLNFSIAIDGEHYTDGSYMIWTGDTEETEVANQARQTADEIASGRLRRIDGKWRLIEDSELASGEELWAALQATKRNEWVDGGAPESATDQSVWDFAGWDVVCHHLWVYGWVILGGDLYARKIEGR